MSEKVTYLDKQCSTTRLCYKLLDGDYLDKNGRIKENLKFKINIPRFKIQNSKLTGKPKDKFETYLFLPSGEGRKGEGGLRTKGYFKFSYKKGTRGKGEGASDEAKGWWIVDGNDNFIEGVNLPEAILRQLSTNNHELTQLPLITVITVVLNGAKYLEKTIQSVINQTYPSVEYIIIDGGSTDGTLDIIKKYEDKIDYWVSEKDSGIYDAMNKGIDLASGKWINFMNAGDAFCNHGVLKKVFVGKDYHRSIGIVYGNTDIGRKILKYKPTISVESFVSGMIICHQSTFYRTDKNIKYNTKYSVCGDQEYTMRYLLRYSALYENQAISLYSLGGISSKSIYRGLKEKKQINKHYNLPILPIYMSFFKSLLIKLREKILSYLNIQITEKEANLSER